MDATNTNLTKHRLKRSTAGNRMQSLLAREFESEEVFMEVDNDEEFIGNEEEDVFDDDFQETDEEASDEAERILRIDEREDGLRRQPRTPLLPRLRLRLKKSAYQKALKPTMLTNALPKAEKPQITRNSKRTATILHTEKVRSSLNDFYRRRASMARRPKIQVAVKTQDALIAQALELEGQNTASLQAFLSREEQKKTQARAVRTTAEGPGVRWISRAHIELPYAGQPSQSSEEPLPSLHDKKFSGGYTSSSVVLAITPSHRLQGHSLSRNLLSRPADSAAQILKPICSISEAANPPNLGSSSNMDEATSDQLCNEAPGSFNYPQQSTSNILSLSTIPRVPIPGANELGTTGEQNAENTLPCIEDSALEREERNYIIIKTGLRAGYMESKKALFGETIQRSSVDPEPCGLQPRDTIVCQFTGLPAKYLDPRTGVPYANVHGYRTISRLLEHGYVWSQELGCYTIDQECTGAGGVPACWTSVAQHGGGSTPVQPSQPVTSPNDVAM